LLGACGKDTDAALLRSLLDSKEERYANAADGLLAGYMQKKPREGWEYLQSVIGDPKKPLLPRLAAMRTLRFYQGAQPKESKPQGLKGLKALLGDPEMADIGVEELRKGKVWDLTADVLKLYGKKGYESPLVRLGIIRYALSCAETKESAAFL